MAAQDLLFVHQTGAPISSSSLVVDANRDGFPEIFVGGRVLHGLHVDGRPLPRWPQRGGRPFASSPALGDINGDSRDELVVGCDDGGVYAFFLDGEPLPGWPVATKKDVFSTPALVDLDGDGALEVIVGSDDGSVSALKGDGTYLWRDRIPEASFVSASPAVVDHEGGSRVLVGGWDGRIHAWDAAGSVARVQAPDARSPIWSSPLAFRTEDGGTYSAWASERFHLHSLQTEREGWARETGSWTVSSPAPFRSKAGDTAVVVGSDRLYAWDLRGDPLPGWPVDLGDYIWASPIVFDVDGDGDREVVVGSWSGAVHAIRRDGSEVPGFPVTTDGPIFATSAAAPLPDGGGILVIASWDGTIRGWRLPRARFSDGDWTHFRGGPARTGLFTPTVSRPRGVALGRIPSAPRERARILEAWGEPWFRGTPRVRVEGVGLRTARRLLLHYRIPGEGRSHPSPVVRGREGYVALVQPLWWTAGVRFWVELEREDGTLQRWPERGTKLLVDLSTALRLTWRRATHAVGLHPVVGTTETG